MPRRTRPEKVKARSRSSAGAAPADPLAHLEPEASAAVLRALLERHPELAAQARALAAKVVARGKSPARGGSAGAGAADTVGAAGEAAAADAVADAVEDAVRGFDIVDLAACSGEHDGVYVGPSDAAADLLQEEVAPFLSDMEREIDLGQRHAASATCRGIVLGLYRVRDEQENEVLAWAPDFPADAAREAVEAFMRRSAAKHGRAWTLSPAVTRTVPEWAAMLARAAGVD